MRQKTLYPLLLVMVLLLTLGLRAEKVATFPDILMPFDILVDNDRFYINESASVHIYSLKDYSLIRTFGRKGEGPGEFKLDDDNQVFVSVLPDCLMINSVGRISYFSKDGTFIKEMPNHSGRWLKPLDDYFVGMRIWYDDKNTRFRTVCIYNPQLKMEKDLYSEEHGIQPKKKVIDAVSWPSSWNYIPYGDKVFVMANDDTIRVFNKKGQLTSTIQLNYKPLKFTAANKEMYIAFYKEEDPYWRSRWERLKAWYVFPEYFPVARYFKIKDEKIYILTYKEENGKNEFLILDTNGKHLQTVFLPLFSEDVLGVNPFDFHGDKCYQLAMNKDTETLELHVTGMKLFSSSSKKKK